MKTNTLTKNTLAEIEELKQIGMKQVSLGEINEILKPFGVICKLTCTYVCRIVSSVKPRSYDTYYGGSAQLYHATSGYGLCNINCPFSEKERKAVFEAVENFYIYHNGFLYTEPR